jgi:spore maturation protein CgeB
MHIAFYGSSLLSSYWNGAATYYRGILRALAGLGHHIVFYEPDAYDRQKHRDIDPPDWAQVKVYPATIEAVRAAIAEAADADVVIKASGVGVFDQELLEGALGAARREALCLFWDVDAPATLAELATSPDHPIRAALSRLDLVLTYGGGPPVVSVYECFGAKFCTPIYNALDPQTHYPVPPDARFDGDLSFLGNRLPDRESRVIAFFLTAAEQLPQHRFILGGAGWEAPSLPRNVEALGHVYTRDHNAFNATPLAVLNIARESMAKVGYSPATRIFEAAGAGACLITDAWEGIEQFLAPETEILVARDGLDVAQRLRALSRTQARAIGERARARVTAEHTYARRATEVDQILTARLAAKRERFAA